MEKHVLHLHWAMENFAFDRQKMIKNSPWSTIYKLDNVESKVSAYLKIENFNESKDYIVSPILSSFFPKNLPRQIAAKPSLRCQLMHDILLTKTKPKLEEILHIYSKIQLQDYGSNLSFLHRTSPKEVLDSFLNDLKNDNSTHRTGLSRFFTNSELSKVQEDFMKRLEKVESLFSVLEVLPNLLSHNDLHIKNVCVDSRGNLVIYDWSDCIISPAGSCLASLIGVSSLYSILTTGKGRDAETVIQYLTRLVDCDLSGRIRCAFIASGLLGALNSILLLTKIQSTNLRFINFSTGIIKTSITSILSILSDKSLNN